MQLVRCTFNMRAGAHGNLDDIHLSFTGVPTEAEACKAVERVCVWLDAALLTTKGAGAVGPGLRLHKYRDLGRHSDQTNAPSRPTTFMKLLQLMQTSMPVISSRTEKSGSLSLPCCPSKSYEHAEAGAQLTCMPGAMQKVDTPRRQSSSTMSPVHRVLGLGDWRSGGAGCNSRSMGRIFRSNS